MKPKNFPDRKRLRQIKAGSPNAPATSQRDVKTKKTPKATWSSARSAHRSGRIGR